MGYVEQNLNSSEIIVQKATTHWGVFVRPALLLILGIVLVNIEAFISLLGWLVLLPAVVIAAKVVALFLTTEMALTNQRVIGKRGILRRSSIELGLSQLEAIKVDQSLLGRILDYGRVSVRGTGGSREYFDGISKPVDFRNKVQSSIAEIAKT